MIDILIELQPDGEVVAFFTPQTPAGEAFCAEQLREWTTFCPSLYRVPKLGMSWVLKSAEVAGLKV